MHDATKLVGALILSICALPFAIVIFVIALGMFLLAPASFIALLEPDLARPRTRHQD